MSTLDDVVPIYKRIIEENGQALPMLLVAAVGEEEKAVYALTQITDDVRPAVYIRQIGAFYAANGRVIEEMVLQNEAWMHRFDGETGEEAPITEVATFTRYHRDGSKELRIIPFTRLGDGTVNWREPELPDEEFDGEVIETMQEVMK